MLCTMATRATTQREVRFSRQVGNIIRARRLELGMTVKDVADRLDRCRNTVDRWEQAQVVPPLVEMVRLAPILRCKVADLLPEGA